MLVQLSPSQKDVVDHFPHFLLGNDTEMTIAGPAGSGKTFILKYLAQINNKIQDFVRVMDHQIPKRRLYFTATTNKAAAVLENMLDIDAKTIHSLLGLRVKSNFRTGRQELIRPKEDDSYFGGKRENLENSIIFVDEASMINHELLREIRKTQREYKDCKVVFVGDEYQLPPVGEEVCPVFNNGPNTVKLKEIQRQLIGNPIIDLSVQYRECLIDHTKPWPVIQPDNQHIFWYENKNDFFNVIRTRYTQPHLADDVRILAWSNSRVRDYNRWIRRLQQLPDTFQPGELVITNKPLMHDEQVLTQTDSVLTIEWVTPYVDDTIVGHHVKFRELSYVFFQPWDWKEADRLADSYRQDARRTKNWEPFFYIKNQWIDVRPIHALTVHKSQGSTYKEVFVDLNNIGKNNHWREVARLTYVAITRSSDKVHIFGSLKERYNRQPAQDLMEPFKDVQHLFAY